jgi:hypothetical protein
MMKFLLKIAFIFSISTNILAKTLEIDYAQYSIVIRLSLKNSLFPDTLRQKGRKHMPLTHNQVIHTNRHFYRFLDTSSSIFRMEK